MDPINPNRRRGIELLIDCIDLLQGINQDQNNLTECSAVARRMFGRPERETWLGANEDGTAVYFGIFNGQGLLVVHGTDLQSQAWPQIRGYLPSWGSLLETNGETHRYPESAYNLSAGIRVTQVMGSLGRFTLDGLTIIGHSFGHAIGCEAFLNYFGVNGNPVPATQIIAFGGNGWANERKKAIIETRAHIIRVNNSDDPVPLAPWLFAEGTDFIIRTNPVLVRRIGNFHHVSHEHYSLGPHGAWEFRSVPDIADRSGFVRTGSLADWLWSFARDITTPHQTGQYRRRLMLLRDSMPAEVVPPPLPDRTRSRPDWAPDPLQPREWIYNQQQTLRAHIGGTEGRMLEVNPVSTTPLPTDSGVRTLFPSDAFVVRRAGPGLYAVCQRGVVSSVFDSKRRAKRQARQLNRDRRRPRPIES